MFFDFVALMACVSFSGVSRVCLPALRKKKKGCIYHRSLVSDPPDKAQERFHAIQTVQASRASGKEKTMSHTRVIFFSGGSLDTLVDN